MATHHNELQHTATYRQSSQTFRSVLTIWCLRNSTSVTAHVRCRYICREREHMCGNGSRISQTSDPNEMYCRQWLQSRLLRITLGAALLRRYRALLRILRRYEAVLWRCTALLRRYRALLHRCISLLQRYRALLRRYKAFLWRHTALLRRYGALLQRYRALLRWYRSLLRRYTVDNDCRADFWEIPCARWERGASIEGCWWKHMCGNGSAVGARADTSNPKISQKSALSSCDAVSLVASWLLRNFRAARLVLDLTLAT